MLVYTPIFALIALYQSLIVSVMFDILFLFIFIFWSNFVAIQYITYRQHAVQCPRRGALIAQRQKLIAW